MLFKHMLPMPDFPATKFGELAAAVAERARRIEVAWPGARGPMAAVRVALDASGRSARELEDVKHYGATPFVRFLGAYLKRVEAAGKLVACEDDKHIGFARTIEWHRKSDVDRILANMVDAGIIGAGDDDDLSRREFEMEHQRILNQLGLRECASDSDESDGRAGAE